MDECGTWAGNDPLLISYHDTRWCHEVHDDDEIFALLVLESMSVGLSWRLILHRETVMAFAPLFARSTTMRRSIS